MKNVRMDANGPDKLRVLLPHGAGTVEIEAAHHTAAGQPRIVVYVTSDTERYGTALDGWDYEVTNAEPGPGVVWLTGKVSRETL